jgi:broad specificity phosphatase PhoE
MNNTFVFVRHAKTKVDKEVPIEDWILTEDGSKSAIELADTEIFDDADILVSSNEKKAYLTIEPLAKRINKIIIQIEELGEIKRPNSEKLTTEQYEEMKVKIFKNLDYTELNWETANHALMRFREAVDKLNKKYTEKKILICAHGTVMTLYFAYLQNKLGDLFSRWEGLGFGSYGLVKNQKVIKDIV